jgi:hypothetical protein
MVRLCQSAFADREAAVIAYVGFRHHVWPLPSLTSPDDDNTGICLDKLRIAGRPLLAEGCRGMATRRHDGQKQAFEGASQ